MSSFAWQSLPPAEEADTNPAPFHTAPAGMLLENCSSPKERHPKGGCLRNQERMQVGFSEYCSQAVTGTRKRDEERRALQMEANTAVERMAGMERGHRRKMSSYSRA